MGKTIREIIAGKAWIRVKPTDSVHHATRAMYKGDVGAVVVMEDDRLRGIFTQRDALRFLTMTRRNPFVIDVGVVMTPDPVTIAADASAEEVKRMMHSKKFHHLPVVDGETVVGVVSLPEREFDLSWPG